jgi:geranylgeranyl pyrophosphate synthase
MEGSHRGKESQANCSSKEFNLIQSSGNRSIDSPDRTSRNDSALPHQLERYATLLSTVQEMLEPAPLHLLLDHHRSKHRFAPILETERIALDFLVRGGKRFRPFVTLAAFDAVRNHPSDATPSSFSPAIHRAVAAIEAFHKASLVHDDIEDEDLFRYGQQTLHREHGIATAINVGDYLVGLGYRWITQSRDELGACCAADILHHLMDAHVRLSEGQGAELAWRKQPDRWLDVSSAQAIYELKTVPAFEAALYVGVRLATDAVPYEQTLKTFSHELGMGFQILNDLKDWKGDPLNKVVVGQDFRALRPTMLLALAIEDASPADRQSVTDLLQNENTSVDGSLLLESIMDKYQVATRCQQMVDEHRAASLRAASQIDHRALRDYLEFLTNRILASSA